MRQRERVGDATGIYTLQKENITEKVFSSMDLVRCARLYSSISDSRSEVYYLLLIAECLTINLYFRSSRNRREFCELSFTSFLVSRNWEQGLLRTTLNFVKW